jgi:Domain of unknown function (DUF1707)
LPEQDPAGGVVRASDEDRERVVAALKEHCAAGRLTIEELPDRVERAYAATTLIELAELTYDLPGRLPVRRHRTQRPARRPRMPGVAPFTEVVEFDRPVTEVETEALREIAPRLVRYGFELVHTARPHLVFERSERPVWTIVVAIVAFPFGLLALLHTRTSRVQLTFDELRENRTRLTIHGSAPLAVRRAFAELRP